MSLAVGQEISGTVTRSYAIAVPDEPVAETLPAIIVFHGGGGDAKVVAKRWGVDPPHPVPEQLADYLLVFPESDPRLGTGWIHFGSDDNGFPTLDIEFVERLVDELTTPLSVPTPSSTIPAVNADPDLLFVAGFSNGAGMVWQLLYSTLESRFQGFAAVGKALDPEKVEHYRAQLDRVGAEPAPAPVVYIQGTADPGYRPPLTQHETRLGSTLPAFTVREMLDRNGICSGGPASTTLVPGSTGITEVVLQRFEGNEAFLLGTVINGGHNWPTPDTKGNPPVADHFDATAAVVEFWRRHAGVAVTVRTTESRLPAGYTAAGLGQAAVAAGAAGPESYALVSFLTSPVSIASAVDYVVFVATGEDVTSYDWTFEYLGASQSHSSTTEIGITSHTPLLLDLLQVTVDLQIANRAPVRLQLLQEVRPRFSGFEFFFEAPPTPAEAENRSIAALGGDPRASDELANDLRDYVLAAAAATDLPPRLIAGVAYHGTMQVPKLDQVGLTVWRPGRDQKLEWVASELNGDFFNLATDLDDRLGVCQLLLPTLATIVGPAGTAGDPYTPWTEQAADGSDASSVANAIGAAFDALPDETKTDLFNLVRFPRTNIELCATLLAALRDRPHRWPGASASVLIADAYAPVTLLSELDAGAGLAPRPTDEHADGELEPTGVGSAIAGVMFLPVPSVLFADTLQEGADSYGGFDLKRDDKDPARRWGGTDPTDAANPPPGNHVQQLQDDLRELGFTLVDDDTQGEFGRNTEWAVRELQVYATMRFVALESAPAEPRYVARLSQTHNLYHYAGPLSGVANVNTRIVIDLWRRRSWRCPVVIEAWDTDLLDVADSNHVPVRTNPSAGLGNLWRHDDATVATTEESDSRVMRARDFSGHYRFPANHQQDFADPDSLIDVGCYFTRDGTGGPLTRCNGRFYKHAVYPSVWPEAEILPDNLLGVRMDAMSAEQRATFKVVRAVSEVECLGFFDSVNCWDRAFVSVGPAHWTLGISNRFNENLVEGELCGYLAYLAAFDRAAFYEAFERFGLRIDETWIDAAGSLDGGDLFITGPRKYTGWVALQGEDGAYSRRYENLSDGHYFQTWHWAYRFIMAGRTITGYQRRMWDMARIRLRDVLGTPIPAALSATVPDVVGADGVPRRPTIGDCFTSEQAAGILHRWHIFQPDDICINGEAGPRVQAALLPAPAVGRGALPGAGTDPSTWVQVDEDQLLAALQAEIANVASDTVRADLTRAIGWVVAWPDYDGRAGRGYQYASDNPTLSTARDSFRDHFDQSGLPPAPWVAP